VTVGRAIPDQNKSWPGKKIKINPMKSAA